MMDMQVLKATQMVFTCLAIVASILGSIVVRGFEGAISDASFRIVWLACLAVLCALCFSGYYGVKKSDARLLGFFSYVSGSLFTMFSAIALLTAATCGGECLT